MTKQELRRLFSEHRQTLTHSEVLEGSKAIAQLFFTHFAVEKLKAVHAYLPIKRRNEVDTFPIIYTLQEKYLKTQIVVPRTIPDTPEMEHYQWLPDMTLVMNQWGILEPDPHHSLRYNIRNIDLVLLPLLAFDLQGYRVGYGKGFYDRFLAQCHPKVLKVGVSLFEPIARIDDLNPFDIRMDYCITPTKVWTWST